VAAKNLSLLAALTLVFTWLPGYAENTDPERDILVTFENEGATVTTVGAPYRARKRYAISADAGRLSADVAAEYGLQEVDHWPIRSLSVYCFVYRIADGEDRATIINRLRNDSRVESVQELNEFEAGSKRVDYYDDTYANLQHGLDTLNLTRAHQHSRGRGIRIAVIDSSADTRHEDLKGRIRIIDKFAPAGSLPDEYHGTAVTSVIVANANNARGIVGVAPEAQLHLYVACWSDPDSDAAICDSFTLAKAIDTLLDKPPGILNMSIAGPPDPLLERLLQVAHRRGTILVAASPDSDDLAFPASMDDVIGVRSGPGSRLEGGPILAPGQQILVAVPDDAYDFRSGSSLAAAHVSGVIALMLAVSPHTKPKSVQSILEQSQSGRNKDDVSIDACLALHLAEPSVDCSG
jgi:subtilisin family serine protease